jgi:hypothetical protein
MSISKKLRFDVFKRDGFQCRYCGKQPPEIILEVDHIIPRNKNGGDEIENLLTSCFDCNRGKGKEELRILPESCDGRAERILEQEEQIKALYREQTKQRKRIEKDIDLIDKKYSALENEEYFLSEKGRLNVKQLLRNFTRSEIEEALEIAFQHPHVKDQFSYACGILWTQKRQREHGNAKP